MQLTEKQQRYVSRTIKLFNVTLTNGFSSAKHAGGKLSYSFAGKCILNTIQKWSV